MSAWISTPTSMIAKIGTSMSAVRNVAAAVRIRPPSPVIAPVICATTTPTHAADSAIRIPAKTNGSDAGTTIVRMICASDAQNARPPSIRSDSTFRAPAAALMRIGSRVDSNTSATWNWRLKPNQRTKRGTRATLGIT